MINTKTTKKGKTPPKADPKKKPNSNEKKRGTPARDKKRNTAQAKPGRAPQQSLKRKRAAANTGGGGQSRLPSFQITVNNEYGRLLRVRARERVSVGCGLTYGGLASTGPTATERIRTGRKTPQKRASMGVTSTIRKKRTHVVTGKVLIRFKVMMWRLSRAASSGRSRSPWGRRHGMEEAPPVAYAR